LFGLCPLAQRAVGFFARFSSSRGVSGLDLGTAAGHGSRHDATPRVSTPLAPECISSSVSIVFSRSTPGGRVTSPRFVGLEKFFFHISYQHHAVQVLSLSSSRFSFDSHGARREGLSHRLGSRIWTAPSFRHRSTVFFSLLILSPSLWSVCAARKDVSPVCGSSVQSIVTDSSLVRFGFARCWFESGLSLVQLGLDPFLNHSSVQRSV
jgi:hypothetical protein